MKKIKSISEIVTSKDTGEKYKRAYTEYDENGNEIVSIDYDFSEAINAKNLTKYDDNNRKIQMQIYTEEDVINETHFYFYNEDGKILKEEIDYSEESKSIKNYNYDANNLTIVTVDENNEIEEKEIIIRNEDNNIIEHKVFDYEGNQTIHEILEYSDKKLTLQKNFDEKDNLTNQRYYKYNDKGQIIFVGVANSRRELLDSSTYEYDEKGREIVRTIGTRGKISTEYNDDEHTVTSITQTGSGQIISQTITTLNEENQTLKEEDFANITDYIYEYFD
ncbi:MAG: hypothetical protein MJ211_09200 [Bacteroidales bacterium]|nr:hypothetical protein [Bacteroidales bacterium]